MAVEVTQARRAALNVLRALRAGELLDPVFARMIEQVPVRDRPWLHELVFGTVRLRGRLDFLLSTHVRRSLAELEPDIIDILRLGAYQLIEMHSVPAYAAVSQAVEMTRVIGRNHVSGLVNGVLQSLGRAPQNNLHPLGRPDGPGELAPPGGRDALHLLSTWGSHPRWLLERWLERYGRLDTEALVATNNLRPDVFLRPIGVSPADAVVLLNALDLEAELVPTVEDAVRIGSADVMRALGAVTGVIQDPAAMLVVRYADFGSGMVADVCAAPGGKALALSGGNGEAPEFLVAGDISFARIGKVKESAARLARTNVAFVVADARMPPLRPIDHALIDAPCTGTGTLRRHPDGKWRLTPADLEALVTLQSEILNAMAELVPPGGLLVYATCSLEPEENELQVQRFLDRFSHYRLEPSATCDPQFLDQGQLRVLPQRHGFDGAYAARMRRAA